MNKTKQILLAALLGVLAISAYATNGTTLFNFQVQNLVPNQQLQTTCTLAGHFSSCTPQAITIPYKNFNNGLFSIITVNSGDNSEWQPACIVTTKDYSLHGPETEAIISIVPAKGYACYINNSNNELFIQKLKL